MIRFAASLTWLFQELDFIDRFRAIAEQGFQGVEIQRPYEYEPTLIAEQLTKYNLEAVLINTPEPLAAIPGEEAAFRGSMLKAISYAEKIGCSKIHCVAGVTASSFANEIYLSNLQWAAQTASEHSINILIEPLNTFDNPGYFLSRSDHAINVIRELNLPNVRLQFDCYHLQIMEGNLEHNIRQFIDDIDHFQIAGVPGRFEPDQNQEIVYSKIFELIDNLGYSGWIGCEYRPRTTTVEGLHWGVKFGLGVQPN